MEELDFEIKLLSNTIDNCPSIKIGIDSTEYFNGEVLGEQTVKFSASVLDNFNLNIDYAGNNDAIKKIKAKAAAAEGTGGGTGGTGGTGDVNLNADNR